MYVGKHGSTVLRLTNVSSFDQILPVFVSILLLFCNHPPNYFSAIFRLSFLHSSTILCQISISCVSTRTLAKTSPHRTLTRMLGWMTPRTTTALTFHLRIALQAQQDLAPALVIHGIRDRKKLSFNPQSLSTSLSPSLPQFLSPFVSPFFFQQVQPPTTLSFLDIPGAGPFRLNANPAMAHLQTMPE
jgi:hypothetical protein